MHCHKQVSRLLALFMFHKIHYSHSKRVLACDYLVHFKQMGTHPSHVPEQVIIEMRKIPLIAAIH